MDVLFLKPIFHEKIWGGTALKDEFDYPIPSEHTGECWAISAHKNGDCIVESGPYEGMHLSEVYKQHQELFDYENKQEFPLLVKILDAKDKLSVQVHPDDQYGKTHAGELGKTECWYILDAKPGAKIVYGHHAQSKESLEEMIEHQQWDDLLNEVDVHPGDFFYVPSGMVHAIGEGIVILETQQSSDTTYRVYDYDRRDEQGCLRELHLEDAVNVIQSPCVYPHPEMKEQLVNGNKITELLNSDFFNVYRYDIRGKYQMRKDAPYYLVSIIEGAGFIEVNHTLHELKKGDHFIIPATVQSWIFSGLFTAIISTPGK